MSWQSGSLASNAAHAPLLGWYSHQFVTFLLDVMREERRERKSDDFYRRAGLPFPASKFDEPLIPTHICLLGEEGVITHFVNQICGDF